MLVLDKMERFDFSNKPFAKALCSRGNKYQIEAINDLKESLGRIRPIKETRTIEEFVSSCAVTVSMHIGRDAAENIGYSSSFFPTKETPKHAPLIVAFSLFLLSGLKAPLEAEGILLNLRELNIDLSILFFMFHPDEERAKNAKDGLDAFHYIVKSGDDKIKSWHENLIKLLDIYILQWTTENNKLKEVNCIPLFGSLLSGLLATF